MVVNGLSDKGSEIGMSTKIPFDFDCQRPFLHTTEQVISRGQWLRDVAIHMTTFKRHPATTWLLHEPDFYRFSVCFVALLAANKKLVLPPNGQAQTVRNMRDVFDIAVLPDSLDEVNCWHAELVPAEEQAHIVIEDEQFIHFYTSGSSGEPKKILKHWYQLEREVACQQRLWADILDHCLIVASVSHQHIYGLIFKLLIPMLLQQPVYMPLIQFPEQLEQINVKNRKLVFISSPAYLSRTANEKQNKTVYRNIIQTFSSGGPLLHDTAQQLKNNADIVPVEVYGSTETGGIAWRQQVMNPLWRALTGINIRVDEQQRLLIRSPFLVSDQWFETDDKATLFDVEHFELQGRVDRIVKLEEKRLSLTELEQALQLHPGCRRAKALIFNGKKRVQLAVVIELAENWSSDQAPQLLRKQFREYLTGFFEPVLLPRKWRFVSELPMDSQGKTSLQVLQRMFD